jgi:hypothetical protein
MSIKHATWPWASRMTGGTLHYKNLYSNTFGYTETQKKVSAGSTGSVITATTGSLTADTTVTSGITQPDVPRLLKLTVANATTSPGTVVVTGRNVEGKVITENFVVPQGTTGDVNGTKAFESVDSMFIPKNMGSTSTYALGTLNALGINHRLFKNNTTVKVYAASSAYGALTLQAAPTVVANGADVEMNNVTPATTPNGTTFLILGYSYDNWADGTSVNDQPEYSTTTSTSSTSSSTSTTTITTSTSSTSSSTSSTSTSSTSSSTSTSSTSTSTTTAP